ncbi:MAG: gamma-glutamyl-gamma-aminobutyrate hydrolase family protein [Phycisphaerales bacterium]|nr:gamma-glutamyl-gamma-aminobutyrate hydrolase family protein [Planctomycetota bacterium]
MRPVIGITTDVTDRAGRTVLDVGAAYARCVEAAGGLPVLLAPLEARIADYIELCSGFVLTGGDDPRMEAFGGVTHPNATPMHPQRQAFESALIQQLALRPERPVLGICLGMQMMCLHAGGKMNQHLPDTHESHAQHWAGEHEVHPVGKSGFFSEAGRVASRHKQAMETCGTLEIIARGTDGVVEAAADPRRPFYVGVQWHPERTASPAFGQELFDRQVRAIRN